MPLRQSSKKSNQVTIKTGWHLDLIDNICSMGRFIKVGVGLCVLGFTAFCSVGAVRSDDKASLEAAPYKQPYEWFASTDPKHKNADYIPLKPGETKRVPLKGGALLRLWSTAFEPDKITMVLQNGNQRVELLKDNKARYGELYQKAFTFYPTSNTPNAVHSLKKGAVLIATNHSKADNKWFYQVTVGQGAPAEVVRQAKSKNDQPPRFDPKQLDDIVRVPALDGQKKLDLDPNVTKPYRLVSAYGSARSVKGQPIPILKVKGEGAFVGLVLDIRPAADTTRRTFAYLEGNEILIADGKKYEGTGTEDYFNSAWYYPEKAFTRPYHGMTFKGMDPPRVTTYRWMIPDAVPFTNNFEFQLEHGNGNNSNDLEYRWVAFWYQKAPFNFEIKDALQGGSARATNISADGTQEEQKPLTWIFVALGGAAIVLVLLVSRARRTS